MGSVVPLFASAFVLSEGADELEDSTICQVSVK